MSARRRGIGSARSRVSIYAVARGAPDRIGGFTRADTVAATVWAEIMPASGREMQESTRLEQRITHKIRMRQRTDVAQGQKLTFGARTFYVEWVKIDERFGMWMTVGVREGGPE